MRVKISGKLNKYKNSATTIFGRAAIVNRYITPTLIYLATTSSVPKDTIQAINQNIREFIFKNTVRTINHCTLVQNKLQGGINLHDIQTKINSLRIKHIGRIVSEPPNHPLAHYYLGLRLNKIIKHNNSTPHFGGEKLSAFYNECLSNLKGNESMIHENTRKIYTHLVKKLATPLQNRIQWCRIYSDIDTTDTFRNLHRKFITPKAREITYRLIFNLTPIYQIMPANQKKNTGCVLCGQNIRETETHLFLTCPVIQMTKLALQKEIKVDNTVLTIDEAITLNKVPKKTDATDRDKNIYALATYRQTIWQARNRAKYDKKKYTSKILKTIFCDSMEKYV